MDLSQISEGKVAFRLVASEIDRIAKESPDRPWVIIPKYSDDLEKGFETITFSEFAAAVDRTSWFIHDTLGPAEPGSFPTIAYCGPSDLRYYFFAVAAVKTGYKLLMLLSGKYTSSSLQYLLNASECHHILRDQNVSIPSLETSTVKFINVPKEEELLATSPIKTYRYEPELPSAFNDPLYVLHTSGSSGKHKPVVFRQGSLGMYYCTSTIPNAPNGQPILLSALTANERIFNAFPIAHSGGVSLGLFLTVYLGNTVILAKDDPLSAQTLLSVVRQTSCQRVVLTPLTCIELVKSPNKAEIYEKLSFINYAGGPLPQAVGDELCKQVLLTSSYGQTENNTPIMYVPDSEDWQYNHFSPEWCNMEFRPAADGVYEAFMIKCPDLHHRYFQPVFWIFPELEEWATNDLFTPHPTKADHWKYAGRADDTIILESGLNFAPALYEQEIWKENPVVKNAIIVGSGKKNLSIIIELEDHSMLKNDRSQLHSRLQASIDEFNERSTTFCQLSLERIIFCEEGESPPRTAKGTFARKQVEAAFRDRIDKLDTST